MYLYLARHGEALTDREDSRRPLSPLGRRCVEDVALRAREAGAKPMRILHSGKLRAQQTAEILTASLNPRELRAIAGLQPEDDPEPAIELAEHSEEDVMLVGHLPHLGILAGRLLRAESGVIFAASTMVCLERAPSGARIGWKMNWKITGESR